MRQYRRFALAAVATAVAGATWTARAADPPAPARPPVTRRADTADTLHGVTIADPYRWLEDQQAPETRAWIDAENAYTDAVIGPLPGKERIERRLTELIKIDVISPPVARGGRYFFTKRAADQEQPILYVRKKDGGADEVLVDPATLSPDHSLSVTLLDVSPDGLVVAYGVRAGGQDEVEVRLMDVDTRRQIDTLPKARYSGINVSADKRSVYYSRLTKEGPRVFRHPVAGAQADAELFGNGYGPEKIISAGLSGDGRYLVVTVLHGSAARKTELYVQDVAAGGPLRPIVNDLDAVFFGDVGGDTLFVRTNWKAPNYRVLAVDLRDPARDKWREVVPEGKSVISNATIAGGRVFVTRLQDVQPRLQAYTPAGTLARDVPLPGIGAASAVSGDWSEDEAFFTFSSFAQPLAIYRHRVSTGATDVWARLSVPVDSAGVEVRQVFYPSRDGTRIPMFVAHRKGLVLDGHRPTLLTAYGGFNVPELPAFSARAAFWIENGGVYALANLRGGGEYGEAWHQAGMLEKKQNVFDDFIAAAEWLTANKYASPDTLAISGGSNGGLLVGAAMTQRPELYKAVVCSYPLLDMLRYQRFFVAGYWVPEYGSAEDEAQFPFLRAYSPYHNVKAGVRYPAVLFITGDGDTRVAPLHARKMAALMQATTGSPPDRPVLLHYDTRAGHSGGLPASKQIEDLTQEMRFLFWQLGVGEPAPRAAAEAAPVVISAGTVVDGRGGRATNVRIVVRGGRIESMGAASGAGAVTYDLSRYTVMPGLIDAHDHLAWHFNRAGKLHTPEDGETPAQGALAMAANAWVTLQAGITTVQSPGSPEDADLRAAIEEGSLPGPRIVTSLEPLDQTSGGPDELRAKVRARKEAGADIVKLFASKSIREGGAQTMSDEQLQAACGEARALGMRTLVHAHSKEAVLAASRAGCTQVEHGVFVDEEALAELARRGTYFDPQCGLVFQNYLDNKGRFFGIGNYNEAGFAAMEKAKDLAVTAMRKALATPGLKVTFGTDAVAGAHGRNVEDLVCRVEKAGDAPMSALVAATSLNAEAMGLGGEIGAVAPGLRADLVGLDGDPGRDVQALRRVVFVMRGGRVYRDDPAR